MNLYNIRKQLNMGIPLTSIHLRVTDYSRVSTDHLEQQNSLKNQVEHFDEMIKNNANWTYIEGYIDNGISGTNDYKRNNFMRMIEDAKNGKFDLIITKEISRFSRNTLDSIKYTRKLLSYGVAVLFISDNINTALPDSELRLTIMASMAQDEIRRLSERVKFGMNRSIQKGNILGNDMLYGYKKDKSTGNLIIIEEEADIIKKIYNYYAINNWSITKIAKTFNDKGIKTRQNKKWCASTLTRMIKNPKYKGYYCGKKTEVIDYMTKKVRLIPECDWILYEDKIKIPPIIDTFLWERANKKLMTKNKKFGKDYQKNKIMYQNRYLLSSKIYCLEHNCVFHRRKQCKSNEDITWTCAKYLNEGKRICNSPNIRESEILTIFEDIIKDLKIDFSNILNILIKIYISNNSNKIDGLKKQRDKILTKKDKLLELNLEGNLSNSEFNNRNSKFNKELSIIDKNIIIIKQQKTDKYFEDIIKEELNDLTIKNKLIDLLLDKIVVSIINDNKENIKLKVFLNTSKSIIKDYKEKIYEFKRGYNTKSTRRYIIKYHVTVINTHKKSF